MEEEEIELTEEEEETEESQEEENPADDLEDGETEEGTEEEDTDELIISIGEESEQEEEDRKPAPKWVKDLRKSNRETQKKNRELEARIKELTGADKAVELGKKPTLEDCDYDSDAFEAAYDAWKEKKREVEAIQTQQKEVQQKEQEAYQQKIETYEKQKTELKVKNFEEVEDFIVENLSQTQQGMIVQGADNSALVFYALSKNPKKAKELAAIKNPVQFAFAIGKLETKLKVSGRKAATKPEGRVKGSGGSSVSGSDSTLDKLREEARKTGDSTKVIAYKRKLRNKKGA